MDTLMGECRHLFSIFMCFCVCLIQAGEVREQRLPVFSEQWQQWDTPRRQDSTTTTEQISVYILLQQPCILIRSKTDNLRYNKNTLNEREW